MIGIILTVCLATSPACIAADGRTCVRTKVCHYEWVPVIREEEVGPAVTQQECERYGQMFLAKPGGWLDEHPDFAIRGFRCGEQAEFQKQHGDIDI